MSVRFPALRANLSNTGNSHLFAAEADVVVWAHKHQLKFAAVRLYSGQVIAGLYGKTNVTKQPNTNTLQCRQQQTMSSMTKAAAN